VDTVSYNNEEGASGVTVNLATGTATDSYGNTDTLIDIERVYGTSFADTLIGGNISNDNFECFAGLDGADTINGGSGWDCVEYYWDRNEGGNNGIVVDLLAGTVRDGFGSTDIISQIEQVRGTSRSDDYKGSNGDDAFMPFGGNDYIDGGSGYDTVSYSIDVWRDGKIGIHADLTAGTIFDTQGFIDTVISIENVEGSFWDDHIVGDGVDNGLFGNGGDDVIKGRAGADRLLGGEGNDRLYGGAGNDYLEGWSGTDRMRGGGGGDTSAHQADNKPMHSHVEKSKPKFRPAFESFSTAC
jgi:Ca2+-binding RTX toxin-like protein